MNLRSVNHHIHVATGGVCGHLIIGGTQAVMHAAIMIMHASGIRREVHHAKGCYVTAAMALADAAAAAATAGVRAEAICATWNFQQ